MKYLAGLFILCVITGTASGQSSVEKEIPAKRQFKHNKHIETKYDKASGETMVRLVFTNLKSNDDDYIDIVFLYTYPGSTPQVVPIGIGISPISIKKALLQAPSLRAKLDGRWYYLGRITQHKKSSIEGLNLTFLEYKLGVITPPQTLMKMVNASKVELVLGDAKFPLNYNQLEALRDFASRMRQ